MTAARRGSSTDKFTQADVTIGCMAGFMKLRVPDVFPANKYPKLHSLALHCETKEDFVKAAPLAGGKLMPPLGSNVDAKTIVDFWMLAGPERQFAKDAAFDGALAVRFSGALRQARLGSFDHWGETPEGALALVILLDQVSRNIHRAVRSHLRLMPKR